jgi:hypothetical protein
MKAINHLITGNIVSDSKSDNILEIITELKCNTYYCEILKFNSLIYYFGGIDPENGEISDNVTYINLMDLNTRKELKLLKCLYAFSIVPSPSRGNFIIVGGLTPQKNSISSNEAVIELTMKEDSITKIK